ncbi:advanced glycosylation end product-specific receptor [Tachyglossus aculeatus]|uniref:advanced glycosylation end product-specific receptor n=1 Tax=Tachyglossus aculeatus TaxID=9261 RepID=UPI0018F6CEF1|nr:advanced glycosylation end product-specific receptor [Tachyglossus aculeatus]
MDAARTWIFLLSLGAAVGGQNISARIGDQLVLNCKGAPRKPPQQLEWKLNTGRTEAWKVLAPQGGPLDSVARVLPNGSLLLPAIGIQDEGTFRCRAVNRAGRETKSNYRVRVYQIPRKPEILDPASELTAGISSKVPSREAGRNRGPPTGQVSSQVGTCVVDGVYPAGAVCWHLNGKILMPDGKGTSVREETRRDPETGLFTVESTLTVVPARGGPPRPAFSCSYGPVRGPDRALHSGPPIRPSVWEPLQEVRLTVRPEGGSVGAGEDVTLTCEAPARPPPRLHWLKDGSPLEAPPGPVLLLTAVGPEQAGTYTCVATGRDQKRRESSVGLSVRLTGWCGPGSVGGRTLETLALVLGVLGALGALALVAGIVVWRRRRRRRQRGEERKPPESQEEEERAELNQPESEEAESSPSQ